MRQNRRIIRAGLMVILLPLMFTVIACEEGGEGADAASIEELIPVDGIDDDSSEALPELDEAELSKIQQDFEDEMLLVENGEDLESVDKEDEEVEIVEEDLDDEELLDKLKGRRQKLKKRKARLKEKVSLRKERLKKINSKIKSKKEEIKDYRVEIKELKVERKTLDKADEDYSDLKEAINQEINDIREGNIEPLKEKVEKIKVVKAKVKKRVNDLREKVKKVNQRLKNIKSRIQDLKN